MSNAQFTMLLVSELAAAAFGLWLIYEALKGRL